MYLQRTQTLKIKEAYVINKNVDEVIRRPLKRDKLIVCLIFLITIK